MNKYFHYLKLNLREEFAYKADFFIDVAFNVSFFLVFFFVWKAVYSSGNLTEIANYSLANTITYYFLTSLIFRLGLGENMYLNREIWNGWITYELVRPYSPKLIYILTAYVMSFISFAFFIPIAIVIIIFAAQYLILPSLAMFLLFLVTILLSLTLAISFNAILHSLCFYFGDQDANITLTNYVFSMLGGALIPLNFLPAGLFQVLNYLPFKFIFYVPINIFMGKVPIDQIYSSWFQMIAWIIVFFSLYYFIFQNGLKKYAAVGR